ncbi:MAG: winged helix-turn-helix domain-containing protein [Candidatus Solibacter usitatus]|nr:winged helix-turn-helix domain-containing protein [Candidatus Solibacter usitatus]
MSGTHGDFRLGPVLVEPDRLRVSMNERVVHVQPRVMDVLVSLALGGTSVTSRQALEAQVWTDAHVGYHALARAVSEARKALEDVSPGCGLLETIPRRGYRLTIAPAPAAADAVGEERQTLHPSLQRRVLAAVVGLVMLGLVMHSAGLHGSAPHLIGAAMMLGAAMWLPPILRASGAFLRGGTARAD